MYTYIRIYNKKIEFNIYILKYFNTNKWNNQHQNSMN